MDLDAYKQIIRGERNGLGPALVRLGLRAASIPYGWGVRTRNWCFDRGWKEVIHASVPVVSVGNLTVGGTGKTPCVEYVAQFFRSLDRRVCILSRGYGAQMGRNDEAMVLEENLPDVPHLQGPDRAALANVAVEELESEVLVLDDGFQHRRLARDLDLVLIDVTCPWGHDCLLPRGLLREPCRGLSRAQVAILTRCDLVQPEQLATLRNEIRRLAPNIDIALTTHRPDVWCNSSRQTMSLDDLKTRPVAAFCGLGNPAAFRQTLEGLGIDVAVWRTFPDHHAYTRTDVESLRNWANELPENAVVVTTQKDLVKIRLDRLGDRELWALKIRLNVLEGKEALQRRMSLVISH